MGCGVGRSAFATAAVADDFNGLHRGLAAAVVFKRLGCRSAKDTRNGRRFGNVGRHVDRELLDPGEFLRSRESIDAVRQEAPRRRWDCTTATRIRRLRMSCHVSTKKHSHENRQRFWGANLSIRLFACLVGLSFLLGTVNGQQRPTSTIQTPANFRGADPVMDQSSIGDLKWFEVFKDPALQDLVRTAMVRNYDLRAAVTRVDAARANLGLAPSEQLPQFDLSTDVTSTRASQNGQRAIPGQGGRSRSFGSVLLNLLTFELDGWGRVRQQTKAARAELRASEEDRKAVMTTVVGDVATGYFSLLELDSELEIAKRTLAAREESLRLIQLRQQGGLATMSDVRQAEELVYQATQTIPDTERLIEQTENQISLLLGNNPSAISRGRPLAEQENLPAIPPGLPSSLLERRPEIGRAHV